MRHTSQSRGRMSCCRHTISSSRRCQLAAVALGLVCLLSAGGDWPAAGLAEDARRPAGPVVPVEGGPWTISTQRQPLFPPVGAGAASQPASAGGLSIVVQPEQATFNGGGPLAFRLTITNTTRQPLQLPDGRPGQDALRLSVSNLLTGAQWNLDGQFAPSAGGVPVRPAERPLVPEDEGKPAPRRPAPGGTVTIAPGGSLERTVVVTAQVRPFPPPQPVPLPRPMPRPLEKQPAAQQDQRGPRIVQAVVVPVGQGPCSATLTLSIKPRRPVGRPVLAGQQWTGRLVSGAFRFRVGPGNPVLPPGGGPVATAQQAVDRAVPVAEAALNAAWRASSPNGPPHQGSWIATPRKSAVVQGSAAAGWTVRWVSFPATGGFRHNVVVRVSANGRAAVAEVFAGWSRNRSETRPGSKSGTP